MGKLKLITEEEYKKALEIIKRFERQKLCNDCSSYKQETYLSGYSSNHNNEMEEDLKIECTCREFNPTKYIRNLECWEGNKEVVKPEWCPKN